MVISENFNREYVGVGFGPYTKHWVGTELPYWNSYSVEDIKDMLKVVTTKFTNIATYSMGVASYNQNNRWDQSDSNCLVSRAAAQLNREKNKNAIRVAQGIFQLDDPNLQQKEINNAFSAAQDANGIHANTVWGLTFTNEYFTNEGTGNKILQMIRTHKTKAHQMGLKVGTRIHVCGIIMNSGSMHEILANIVRESDFIMCNLYPTSNVVHNVNNAVEAVGNAYLSYVPKFKAINPHIEVMIGETGWPSEGISFNQSPNNVQNLKQYWTSMGEWAAKHRVSVYMFEAIDEPWKSNKNSHDMNAFNGPNGAEGHYGWWKRTDNNQNHYVEK